MERSDFFQFVKHFKPKEGCFDLKRSLKYVRLPDLLSRDISRMRLSVRDLFDSLEKKFGVHEIVTLFVKDNPLAPVSDDEIADYVVRLKVRTLDWEKYDMDIEPMLAKAETFRVDLSIKHITLYCTGHRGVLRHWFSDQGLSAFPKVCITLWQFCP
jgi:hypothetical protein